MRIIINIFEALILTGFLGNYINIKNKQRFISLFSMIIFLELTLFDEIIELEHLSSIVLLITYSIGIYACSKKYLLDDFNACLLTLGLNYVSNFVAVMIFSIVLNKSIQFVCLSNYFIYSLVLSKFILVICAYALIKLKTKVITKIISNNEWILTSLFLIFMSGIYFISYKLVFKQWREYDLYKIIVIIIVEFIFLCVILKISYDNEQNMKYQLALQKEYYEKQNQMLLDHKYNELKRIEHEMLYRLLYIKNNLQNEEVVDYIDQSIENISKVKNFSNTKDSLFDYEMNKFELEYSYTNPNIKTVLCFENPTIFNELLVKQFFTIVRYLMTKADSNSLFEIHVNADSHKIFGKLYLKLNETIDKDELVQDDWLIDIITKDNLTIVSFSYLKF